MMQVTSKTSETTLSFVHRANIHKYTKLLQTVLTEHERAFIRRRLHEERRALADLYRSTDAVSNCG